MSDSIYDYRLECEALENQLSDKKILVTEWRGTEAVSQLYRFEITVAVRHADVKLEDLLDQKATLRLRHPDGSAGQWHGIITQCAQLGRDENHDYYELTLEPRLARLALLRWSDIYLDKQLDALIDELLERAGLDEKYAGDDTPYDYRVAVSDADLSLMKRDFTCQFEETCLDFLKRKLEFYGVYFWFEQGDDREAIVFGNDVSQQPGDLPDAVYYPRGEPDVDEERVVIKRLDRRVSMQADKVSLHSLHDQDNTTLDMTAEANVPAIPAERGWFQSVDDHFSLIEGQGSAEKGVAGEALAGWRAEELACQSLQLRGEAHTPGVRAGRFLSVSEYRRNGIPEQYYVIRVEHYGAQAYQHSADNETTSYQARFVALPRWRDAEQSDPVQFRPPRVTPVPRVSRLLSGFVDITDDKNPKRYAQPDEYGRYQIRLPFVRERYEGYKNSAWLRQSTPYAAAGARSGVDTAGMHFPLREGTEVLIAFLNGDTDYPVIVGSLPNTEAPSVVSSKNAREHVLRTPGGCEFIITDGGDGSTTNGPDGQPVTQDTSEIRLATPMTNARLTLGGGLKAEGGGSEQGPVGFDLRTNYSGEIYAGESLLIEVPGHYRVAAGGTERDALTNFLGSEATLAPGVTAGQSGGVVFENFTGAKFSTAESSSTELTVGHSTEVFAGLKMDASFAFGASVTWSGIKELNLEGKDEVWTECRALGMSRWETFKELYNFTSSTSTTTINYKVEAMNECALTGLVKAELQSVGSTLKVEPASIDLDVPVGQVGVNSVDFKVSAISAVVDGALATLTLDDEAKLSSKSTLTLDAVGVATMGGNLIRIG